MAFRLQLDQALDKDLRRIAGELIDDARGRLAGDVSPDDVHEVRKDCKKLRAVLSLLRPLLGGAWKRQDARLRAVARALAASRDAEVAAAAWARLLAHRADMAEFVASCGALPAPEPVPPPPTQAVRRALRRELREAQRDTGSWPLDRADFLLIADGLRDTYRAARQGMRAALARPTVEARHVWRRHAKYHGYHARLLLPVWPAMLQVHVDGLEELAELLGEDHDLHQLMLLQQARLTSLQLERLAELIGAEQGALQQRAFALGDRLFEERPKALVRRWGGYWHGAAAWQG